MSCLSGLATGIGSLPHTDAAKAVELVLKYCPQLPFWPQLPRRDMREGMVAQFSEGLPCLKLAGQGVVFNAENKENQLEKFYEKVIGGELENFKISPDYASGLYAFCEELNKAGLKNIKALKCHITGPLTFAAAIKNEEGKALLHDEVFMQAVIKGLAMKALWQIKFFKKFGKKIIIFIDEPYLACLGSGYTPVNKEGVAKILNELTQEIKSEDVLIGVHCCGNTDWTVFTDTEGIDIINFDAFGYLDKLLLYADDLKKFFGRGGMLCWGIVPTQEFSGKEKVKDLIAKIKEGVCALAKKGIEEKVARAGLLLSPACGLGTLEPAKAEAVLKLLSETSAKISI